jgi:hypothetical protein
MFESKPTANSLWCFDSKAIGLDCPSCSVVFCGVSMVFRESLGCKDFFGLITVVSLGVSVVSRGV